MKLSMAEARIIVYLSQVDNFHKTITIINQKLKLEYSYLCRTLREMKDKGYLHRHKLGGENNVVYDLMKKGKDKIKEAVETLK